MTAREKTIYLAGILDGEGCFTTLKMVNGRREYHVVPVIAVTQKDVRLLTWIYENFGGYVSGPGKNGCAQWSIKGKKAKLLAQLVQPYLIVKKEQVLRTIDCICPNCGSTYISAT